jgi:transposase
VKFPVKGKEILLRVVAKRFNISESTISRILKWWKQKGDIENVHRPGTPKATSDRADRTFVEDCKNNVNFFRLHFFRYKRQSVRKTIGIRSVYKKKRL